MKRFTGHTEPWGQFVDIKINAAILLTKEITKKKRGRVWISGVCDPYQPLEARYGLTRQCLKILIEYGWPITVQTRSPLVVRDLDLFRSATELEVGMSVPTADESIRRMFEPHAPLIKLRIDALGQLHGAGIRTFAMIAPLLPEAQGLAEMLTGKVDYVLIDKMNYDHANWVYSKYHLDDKRSDPFFAKASRELAERFRNHGIDCTIVFS